MPRINGVLRFLYVSAAVLSILLNNIRLPHGNGLLSLHGFAYSLCLKPALGDYFGSLVYALLFVALNWGGCRVLKIV